MKSFIKSAFLSTAMFVGTPVFAQDQVITFTPDGIADCGDNSGGNPANRGELTTLFGNQFWSRLSCADWDGAKELLDRAPKSSFERGIPSPLDLTSEFSECYYGSFPYPREYHNVRFETDESGNEEVSVKHGFFGISGQMFSDIQRATVAACEAKIS